MKIAIPELNERIAPCFETAKQFEIFVIKNGKIISTKTINFHATEDSKLIRLLKLHEIQVLICNGIENFFRDQLLAFGITVIPNINEPINKTLDLYLTGKLSPDNNFVENEQYEVVSHDNLVAWAKKLFKSNGYEVSTSPAGQDCFLIDFVASIKCPVCNKIIEAAVCCGAQTYRTDQEIREFHHNASTRYDALVYVYLSNPQLEKSCFEYGINFLSPEISERGTNETFISKIPILQRPIAGHEKAFIYAK